MRSNKSNFGRRVEGECGHCGLRARYKKSRLISLSSISLFFSSMRAQAAMSATSSGLSGRQSGRLAGQIVSTDCLNWAVQLYLDGIAQQRIVSSAPRGAFR